MQSLYTVVLVFHLSIHVGVEACHNAEHMQEASCLESSGRRKRSLVEEGSVTYWKTDYTVAPDADPELAAFFTKCMLGKTGNIFESWTSVIDLILRDLLWFEATDAEYCGGRKDTVKCWHRRLKFLLRSSSSLVTPGKECITEYDQMVKNEYGPDFELHYKTFYESFEYEPAIGEYKRWKRSTIFNDLIGRANDILNNLDAKLDIKFTTPRTYFLTNSPTTTTTTVLFEQHGQCPAFDLLAFNNCVTSKVNALDSDIVREYPSLRNFNEDSNSKFIRDHHSRCRITKSKSDDGFTYTENCEVTSNQEEEEALVVTPLPFVPFQSVPFKSCLIVDYPELVKHSSPIYVPVSTCADKYLEEIPTNKTTDDIDRSTLERPKNRGRIGKKCLKGIDLWTKWYNIDDPSDDGDMETLSSIRTSFRGQVCENPKAVEARTSVGHRYFSSTKQLLYLSTNDGLRCFNDEQTVGECDDYKIRFCCSVEWPTCEEPNQWTPWFNLDRRPRVGGDDESLEKHIAKNAVCPAPVSVQARLYKRKKHYLFGQNVITVLPETGLVCKNSEQDKKLCSDYEVSFCCTP